MTPEAATAKQIDGYKRMSCEERISVALGLHELACEMVRAGIRVQQPGATEAEIGRLLRQRLELAGGR